MNKQKRLGIVAAATVVFGIFSKWLVGVPYMAWGYFDKIFVASFLTMVLLCSSFIYCCQTGNRQEIKLFEDCGSGVGIWHSCSICKNGH